MMKWKIYFWIMTFISLGVILNTIRYITSGNPTNVGDYLIVVIYVILLLGLYSYVFSKKVLNARAWKLIFWLHVIYSVAPFFFLPDTTFLTPMMTQESFKQEPISNGEILGLLVLIPFVYFIPLYVEYQLSKGRFLTTKKTSGKKS
jgi:cellulose synthase/poly-beta-1,6-N-acetylglucosamine synthase-like glycosyltransferase